jgi:hypothetical protein
VHETHHVMQFEGDIIFHPNEQNTI